EHLRLHLARLQGAGEFEEPIGERGLPVVDMRDDREVADELLIQGRIRAPGNERVADGIIPLCQRQRFWARSTTMAALSAARGPILEALMTLFRAIVVLLAFPAVLAAQGPDPRLVEYINAIKAIDNHAHVVAPDVEHDTDFDALR